MTTKGRSADHEEHEDDQKVLSCPDDDSRYRV